MQHGSYVNLTGDYLESLVGILDNRVCAVMMLSDPIAHRNEMETFHTFVMKRSVAARARIVP